MKNSPEEPFLGLTEYTLSGNEISAAAAKAVISTDHEQPSWGAMYIPNVGLSAAYGFNAGESDLQMVGDGKLIHAGWKPLDGRASCRERVFGRASCRERV